MSGNLRRALAAALAVLATVAIAALTRLPFEATAGEHALIRLSWRAPGEYIEECRRLSAEELAQLPVHMRREEVCERRPVPFRLRVLLDGRTLIEERVEPAGARRDRPLYVFQELPVAAGDHRIEVRWEPEFPAGEAAAATPRDERPGTLAMEASLRLRPGEIALITYDRDRRTLAARGRGILAAEVR